MQHPAQAAVDAPVSFVVRLHGVAELQRSTAALQPRLAIALRRILGLATEAERVAIRDDLHELAGDVAQLAARARAARKRGDRAGAAIARVERALAEAEATLAKLHDGLRYANSVEELQALALRAPEPAEPATWHDIDDRVDVVMTPLSSPNLLWRRGVFDRP